MSTGTVPPSQGTGGLSAGDYGFQAVYTGDSNYSGSTSPCEPFTVSGGAVGGVTLPVDKVGLLMPYIESSLLVLAGAFAAILYLRRAGRAKASV